MGWILLKKARNKSVIAIDLYDNKDPGNQRKNTRISLQEKKIKCIKRLHQESKGATHRIRKHTSNHVYDKKLISRKNKEWWKLNNYKKSDLKMEQELEQFKKVANKVIKR